FHLAAAQGFSATTGPWDLVLSGADHGYGLAHASIPAIPNSSPYPPSRHRHANGAAHECSVQNRLKLTHSLCPSFVALIMVPGGAEGMTGTQ
ncbi:hypothetical protein KUCAC02_029821, partial [Chaenocephalus aceratus]